MGFFQAITRIAKGEPVFQAGDKQPTGQADTGYSGEPSLSRQSEQPQAAAATVQPIDPPRLDLSDPDSNLSSDGKTMELWVEIRNPSPYALEINKVSFLGRLSERFEHVRAGGFEKMVVYQGPSLTQQSSEDLEVIFRLVDTGERYSARYDVVYRLEGSVYEPAQFRLQLPVRKI